MTLSARGVLRRYYAVSLVYALAGGFLVGVYPLFLRARGLNQLEINSLLATYFIVTFLTDVPTGVFADSFGIFVDAEYPVQNIEVSLAPRWAPFVRSHRWHRSQESFVRAGRVHVRMRVRLDPEVVAWVLSLGPDVRVVRPPVLQRRIARLARQMAKAHSGSGS